jgi:hypothetical protein
MQLSHDFSRVRHSFDDPNLVAFGGLVPVLELARRAGLHELVAGRCTPADVPGSANAALKIPALVAGMVAGADSIDDMDLLRHGGMPIAFAGIRAPSTLGTFLRTFSFGHVRQLDSVAAGLLAGLARHAPVIGAGDLVLVDVDDTMRQTHGYAKQGVAYGYSKVKGLNALIATISTPTSAPLIAAARLRKGNSASARGAGRLLAEALSAAAGAGIDCRQRLVLVRADSAYYQHKFITAAQRRGARFSVTARMNPAVRAAIAAIPDDAWTPIHYPNASVDTDTGLLVSDAEVAEVPVFTAFASKGKGQEITARLIVRRVRRLNPRSAAGEQDELFAAHRHHAVFTDSPMTMLQAETQHRGHAIVEQVIAELKNGPLAHLPSGKFTANAAWLVLATMAYNLTRAAGTLASTFHAKATLATVRAHLIAVPARLARSARALMLHLPTDWPWRHAWSGLFDTTCGPPTAA